MAQDGSQSDNQIELFTDNVLPILIDWGMTALGALGIFIIGWIAARIFGGIAARMVGKNSYVDPTLKPFIASLVRYTILIVTIVATIIQIGVPAASILAVLGAAGLAVGLALQGTLSNIAAGVMLLFLRPLKIGEFIDADGVSGTVREIGLFTTTLSTPDGIHVVSPNSQLWTSTIKNYSRAPTRRIDVTVGIGYDDDIDTGLKILSDIAAGEPRILTDPPAQTMVLNLGDNAVDINLRVWVNTPDFWDVTFTLTKAAKTAIEAGGLSIPYPQRTLHMTSGDPPAAQSA